MDVYLGVDVGTTHVKVAALAEDLRLEVARAPTPVGDDGHGPVHQPAALLATVRMLAREAVGRLGAVRVRALAAASVGEEGVMLDRHGRTLYPALAWFARRRSRTADAFLAAHPAAETYAACGLPPDAIHSLFHWAWLSDHQPEVLRRAATWLSLDALVAFECSGAAAIGPSQASRSHAWSPFAEDWLPNWADAVGVRPDVLPPVRPAGSVLGPLREDALPGVPLAPGAVAVVGGHDHAVGAWAAGVGAPGVVLDSLGTAESLYALAEPGSTTTTAGLHAFLQHGRAVLPVSRAPRYVQAALHSGRGMAALARLLGRPADALDAGAANVPAGAGGMRYRAPLWADEPRGVLEAIPLESAPELVARAILEGWARASVHALGELGRERGRGVERVRAIGGGTRLLTWMAIRASMLPCPLEVVGEPELVALGAALLAREAVAPGGPALPLGLGVVEPVAAWHDHYAAEGSEGEDADGSLSLPRSTGPPAGG